MEKRTQALDLDALRSFVVGIESGSFALAAKRLCRSTSAVSAQLKKLEMQCGVALVVKNGRHLALTQHGEIVLGYARRMLALNDEAQRALQGELLQGEIRIGMQEDFGESLMPGMLGQLKRHHPGLRISARIDRNHALLSGLAEKTLDMALMWQPDTPLQDGRLLGRCQLEWVYHRELDIDALLAQGEPLPLVMFASPCLMRARATACLDRAGIPWRVMFVSHSLSGIWAAVQAGLGITVRTRIGMPDNLRIAGGQLPSPGNLGIVLGQTPADGEAGTVRTLVARLMEEALADIR
ncbi:CysJI operon transcriptional activator [Serratia rubidaea]|uniref:CysJI operon transcriptional activator n=1 Tax=Serratia rubidaea TaxID=61652 RepID=A0A4U9HG54_SERRU|nr:LysR substrate-binding domain-containing protein [Serratia rubidaea]QPR61855.1 LysR family transcriptional regulator [Serratia rubidaea]CAI0935347.1 CysJI operon transcriptional activator [Serratia rubidaea]CAI1750798.1 CysJI operon transcriptional activator [Serratia rubidaea]VTP61069.1 CysJI operon transcriptional activator [Serratia rubidaea]HAY0636713.1 LysR family transcriptional regulator [Serratia rubidaea]